MAHAPAVANDTATTYTCPMHPEVRKNGPGTCPICGMALEPETVSLSDKPDPEFTDMRCRFVVGAVLSLPLAALAMEGHMLPQIPFPAYVQLALATPVVLWCGKPFLARGWASLLSRNFNMFTLIALGVMAAYLYSLAVTAFPSVFAGLLGGHPALYFEAAAVITTLALLGQVLELKARARTSHALRQLLGLAPKTARLVDGGSERDVPLESINKGDLLRVRPGEKIPADGVIVDGSGAVDQSMMTGEPMPVSVSAGSKVTGATLNLQGTFVLRAEKVGGETLLARIVNMVGQAQRTRAPVQKLADKVAGVFVPAVILVAVLTATLWAVFGPEPKLAHALVNAVAVLIIACPCALGLATPMSVMAGMGRGARAGILVRNAEALERLEKIDTLVVDKTGTLTEGKPRLSTVVAAQGFDEATVLRLAAGLERGSEHPLARAILDGAAEKKLTLVAPEDFKSVTGKGLTGTVEGRKVAIGNLILLHTLSVKTDMVKDLAEPYRHKGQTVMFVAVDGQAAGFVTVADPVKATTAEALKQLKASGLSIVMLTGDSQTTAEAVARKLGIDDVRAGVLPERKADVIKELQKKCHKVAMAGDGINDAPALARADVGIAMGDGTDIAMESAHVTLVKGDLMGIVRARALSHAVMRNIRQNLFFAFAYNLLGVPLAAGVLYPFTGLTLSPVIASAAMALSSVSVIANALRLNRAKL